MHGSRAQTTRIELAYPTIFIVPSQFKDANIIGGQAQVRISFKKPAAQTDPPPIQMCYRSRWLGGVLISMDLDQIELKLQALCSGDRFLVRCFTTGLDPHAERAVQFEGPEVRNHPHFKSGDRREDPRQWYKQVNFLIGYKGGPTKLQTTLLKLSGRRFSHDFCSSVIDQVPSRSPELCDWQDALVTEAHAKTYLEVPFLGVSRAFLGGGDYDVNEIVNVLPQSLAAAVTHRILARLYALYPLRPVPVRQPVCFLHNHDSLKWDCPTPAAADQLEEHIEAAVEYVRTQDLWAMLEALYDRKIPLTYSLQRKEF